MCYLECICLPGLGDMVHVLLRVLLECVSQSMHVSRLIRLVLEVLLDPQRMVTTESTAYYSHSSTVHSVAFGALLALLAFTFKPASMNLQEDRGRRR